MFILFIICYFIKLSSPSILNCQISDKFNDSLCIKCENKYYLDQYGQTCILSLPKFLHCIQVSIYLNCMRCDCGYSLTGQGSCQLSAPEMIGCEILNKSNVCIRPKAEYTLIYKENEFRGIQNGRGSHCEIINIDNRKCEQCHSGYFLNYKRLCLKSKPLANEFFSYYSQDGQIMSRDYQFVVGHNGVYKEIKYCIEQKGQDDLKSSICEKCQSGKVINEDRSACLKPPFEECGMVSNKNPNKCIVCIDNENFYLKTYEAYDLQQCVPREQEILEKCLLYEQKSNHCLLCADGLILTNTGCSLLKIKEGSTINQTQFNSSNIMPEDCEYVDENFKCKSCSLGTIINTEGKCKISHDQNCRELFEDGSCKKCRQFMFYDKDIKICTQINNIRLCLYSSGENDYCDLCVDGSILNSNGICVQGNIQECFQYSENHICTRCNSLHYLENSKCQQIQARNCLVSDGITNLCQKCKKFFIMDEDSFCIPEKLKKDELLCIKNLFYASIVGDTLQCIEYTNKNGCFIFHDYKDECLQCFSPYFIEEGKCKLIDNCLYTNGISSQCMMSNQYSMYVDSKGDIQMMKTLCRSNMMENICTTCKDNKEQDGIYFKEECVPKNQIPPLVKNNCLHLSKKGDYYVCELCESLMYPNSNGICFFIGDMNCLLSNGRSKECILCQQLFQLDPLTKKCKNKVQYIPNCKTYTNQNCIKCESLYYFESEFCLPISDPDCLSSFGMNDQCIICNNQFQFILQPPFHFCNFSLCENQDSSSNSCLKCPSGFILSKSLIQNTNQIEEVKLKQIQLNFEQFYFQTFACAYKIINNCQETDVQQQCTKCEEGYYLIDYSGQDIVCAKNFLENCQYISLNGIKCLTCMDGYHLLLNGQCLEIKGCINFVTECFQCSGDYFLSNGKCYKIFKCEEQFNDKCLKCKEGYSLRKKGNNFNHSKNFNDIIFEQCLEISNCAKSDGVLGCLECKKGYYLKYLICYNNRSALCISQESNKCIQCKNLYYLEDGECLQMNHNNCDESDGIDNQCIRCETNGFYLSAEKQQQQFCKKILNCVVSNGVNTCVICEQDFFANDEGKCLPYKINNCQYLQKQSTLQIFKEQINDKIIYGKVNFNERKSIPNLDNIPPIGCTQCENFFYLKTFEECSLIDKSNLQNCLETNSMTQLCYVCFPGYNLKLQVSQHIPQCFLQQKKFLKTNNIGCSHLNTFDVCLECYPNFYLNDKDKCIQRQRYQKCHIFNSIKDECLICKSGYTLLSLDSNQKVCMKLLSSEEVENCKIYKPNSNKCQECIKFFEQEDFIEFLLNEEQNICENVKDLMCHKLDPITKSCLVSYVFQCKEYGNNAECVKCHHGFYFDKLAILCKQHKKIENCLIFNSRKKNSCKKCKPLYFLQLDHTCSILINPHCQIISEDQNVCSFCEEKYAIDLESGFCVLSQIENCQILKTSLQNNQMCIQCLDNFVLQHQDINCEELNESYECIKCKLGYLLTIKGDCIDLNSICSIQNCLKYDNNSSQDSIQCEQCHPNFSMNSELKCSAFDPNSEVESQTKIKPDTSNEETKIQIILVCLILIMLISLLWKIFKQNTTIKQVKEEGDNTIELQIDVSSNFESSKVCNDDLTFNKITFEDLKGIDIGIGNSEKQNE